MSRPSGADQTIVVTIYQKTLDHLSDTFSLCYLDGGFETNFLGLAILVIIVRSTL